jgi:HlyD family secretion protein
MDQDLREGPKGAADAAEPVTTPSPQNPETLPARLESALPAIVAKRASGRRWSLRVLVLLAGLLGGAGGGYYWWQHMHPALPAGIVFGNGRLEADEIDIDTKYAGRIAEILADEGDLVKAGQVVARMDTQDLAASQRKSEAQVRGAQQAVDQGHANVDQLQSQVLLAQQEMDRANALLQKDFQTKEVFDQRKQQLDGAQAALTAARSRVTELEHLLDAATHDVELYKIQIADNSLIAPRDGRIQYRIANIGEVLPAGGKVFAMLDVSDVYMDIYLPTEEAGKAKFGADARIVLDAYPNVAIPARVSFIATQAQFTPKTVETKNERDKLMFRIRVQIDPQRSQKRADEVRSGLPGVAYVLTGHDTVWPEALRNVPSL